MQVAKKLLVQVGENFLINTEIKFIKILLKSRAPGHPFPIKDFFDHFVVSGYLQMFKTVGTTLYPNQKNQNQFFWLIASVKTLDW